MRKTPGGEVELLILCIMSHDNRLLLIVKYLLDNLNIVEKMLRRRLNICWDCPNIDRKDAAGSADAIRLWIIYAATRWSLFKKRWNKCSSFLKRLLASQHLLRRLLRRLNIVLRRLNIVLRACWGSSTKFETKNFEHETISSKSEHVSCRPWAALQDALLCSGIGLLMCGTR